MISPTAFSSSLLLFACLDVKAALAAPSSMKDGFLMSPHLLAQAESTDLYSSGLLHWNAQVGVLVLLCWLTARTVAHIWGWRWSKGAEQHLFDLFNRCWRIAVDLWAAGGGSARQRPDWLTELQEQRVLGQGAFGTVTLVHSARAPGQAFALKCVQRTSKVARWHDDLLRAELEVAAMCSHPCIVPVYRSFEEPGAVFFLMEFLGGGDLFGAIRQIGVLQKQHVRFYAGSITLALEHLHQQGVMYRDLKPENVLLDGQGRAKLVDFGCCKVAPKANTLVGTSEYMAPEVILGRGYTNVIDWWALGVVLHELVVGPLPFGRDGQDQKEIFEEVLHAPLLHLPAVEDLVAGSAISCLLERDPSRRLGSNGAIDVKHHSYFADFDWKALGRGCLASPWVPERLEAHSHLEESGEP
mmetsp:Transcript_48213/g.138447  ORF Transcript_48213/g.138447 Transcript_48213/m.138447 type:complete len:412 (-) Transcript_48213:327-1562(-)